MTDNKQKYNHIFIKNLSKTQPYSSRPAPIPKRFKDDLDRASHGNYLRTKLEEVICTQKAKLIEETNKLDDDFRYSVTFDGFDGFDVAVSSLASGGIEFLNLQEIESLSEHGSLFQRVTVSIPKNSLVTFEKKIDNYLTENTKKGIPRNQRLIQSLEELKLTTLKDLWNDDFRLYPQNENQHFWFEVWLNNSKADLESFNRLAKEAECEVQATYIVFPERLVLLLNGSLKKLSSRLELQNYIASFRLSKATAAFFDELTPPEQVEWVEELIDRHTYKNDSNCVICVLDTGINYAHPLLTKVMDNHDQLAENPNDTPADLNGHGTGMAGVATYGDLTPLLESQDLYTINYGLESVKILDGNGANEDKNFGYITSNAVSISEIGHPNRKRIFVMPVTTLEAEHGKPTAWSSSIDALCADSTTEVLEQKNPRLFILAAGNLDKRINSLQFSYPTENEKQEVANPAQAWNAISVGAITYKVKIDEVSSYSPVANLGELSPHSTTSVSDTWDSNMPLKPEIVFEGGNCGEDAFSKSTLTSLSLLTTYYNFTDRLFSSFNATSAASAMAANFAIKILSKYPNIWPETIRGLMVHSAEWNKALRYQFGSDLLEGNGEVLGSKTKEFARRMRKRVGFGEPNLNNALNSFRSSAVVILEEEFQPYRKGKNSIGSNLLQVDLPWPKEEIQNLLTLQVKLKVTLSYFIEPNPSGQAAGRYSYPSHQLKFDLKRANESAENFLARIDENTKNKMLESDRLIQKVDHDKWFFGIDARSKGSIQKDVWIGSATELADRDVLVIFPTTGWWKTRTKLRRFNSKTRISLIVSLEALNPEIDIDLYTSIQNKVDSMVKVKASVVV